MKLSVLMLTVALAAACSDGGNNTSPDSGASVNPMIDGGNPAPDTSAQPDSPPTPPAEAAVPEDMPPPPVDAPATSTECWSQACGNQWLVTEGSDSARMVTMTCDMAGRRISLSPTGTGCVATCTGDSCSCVPDDIDVDGYSVVLQNQREANGSCGMQSRIIPMHNGTPMPSTRHLVRRE